MAIAICAEAGGNSLKVESRRETNVRSAIVALSKQDTGRVVNSPRGRKLVEASGRTSEYTRSLKVRRYCGLCAATGQQNDAAKRASLQAQRVRETERVR